ncbi:MAG: pyridoxamine 5'-phosphate oxidase family protein [Anaerovoracaceae bacterium]
MGSKMRRAEKAIPQEECVEVLEKSDYLELATISPDDTPYVVPMTYAYVDGVIYIHCAKTGHRMENLAYKNTVCFNVVDPESIVIMPEEFNTQYRSVTGFGKVTKVEDVEEKKKGAMALSDKYSPQFHEEGLKYMNDTFNAMFILRIDIDTMTGKATRG